MNEVGTLVNVTVAHDVVDSAVIDAARGVLQGYTGAYYLFAYDTDDYCLVLSDDATFVNVGGFYGVDMADCQVIQFRRVDTPVSHSQQLPYSGSINGTVTGIESGGLLHASESGNITNQYTTITSEYFMMTYQRSSVKVSNPSGYLCYGSADNLPKLVEGVQNYAFLAVCLAVAVIAFRLADRLFRRVY